MNASQKILLIRFSSIGDIVLTSPVVRCIKQQLPECELHVLTKKQNELLFAYNPNVDKVHVLKDSLTEVIRELKREAFSFVVDLHCNLRSFRVRKALGAPGAGFSKLNLKKYLLVRLKWNLMPDLHVVDRYFEATKQLGVINDMAGLDFFTGDVMLPQDIHPWISSPFVAVVVGGQHNTKIFPPEKVAAVVRRLSLPVVLLGGPADVERAENVVELAKQSTVWNACGKLDLFQSAKVVEASSAVLTNDTGLMHIAAAFRKPVVSVWGNTVPAFGMWPYMPGEQHKSVIIEIKALSCRPCSKLGHKRCPKKHFNCMNLIDEEVVVSAISQLIDKQAS